MRLNKRRTKKEQIRHRKKLSIFGICAVYVFSFLVSFTYIYLRSHDTSYKSPLSSQKNPIQKVNTNGYDVGQVLQSQLKKVGVEFDTIEVSTESSYLVTLKTGELVIVSQKKDIGKQLSSLQVILSRLTMEGKRFVKLDLRFDKPVIVFHE